MSHPPLPPRPPTAARSPSPLHNQRAPSPLPPPTSTPSSSFTSPTPPPTPTSLRTSTPLFPTPPTFTLPEYWDFPPFFTLQPNLTTRSRQLRLWVDLLVSFASSLTHPSPPLPSPPPPSWCLTPSPLPPSRCPPSSRTLSLSPSSLAFPLWGNRRLQRQLSGDAVVSVLDEVVAAGYGVWGEGRSVCVVSGRSVADWAEAVYAWAVEQGLDGGVATLFELQTAQAASKQRQHSQRVAAHSTPSHLQLAARSSSSLQCWCGCVMDVMRVQPSMV